LRGDAEVRIVDIRDTASVKTVDGIGEIRVVEDVEGFHFELQVDPLRRMAGVERSTEAIRPFTRLKEPFVELQSRREPRINKFRSFKFNRDRQEQRGECLEQIGNDY
jgi:hypothetical protein